MLNTIIYGHTEPLNNLNNETLDEYPMQCMFVCGVCMGDCVCRGVCACVVACRCRCQKQNKNNLILNTLLFIYRTQ